VNWIKPFFMSVAFAMTFVFAAIGFTVWVRSVAAHAQKPEPSTPQVQSDFFVPYKDSYHLRLCPVVAGQKYCVSYEREGEARAQFDEIAQKPEPTVSLNTKTCATGAVMPNMHEIYLVKGGTRIATFDDKGNLTIIEPTFWKMVESHCVAVLTEKQDVQHDADNFQAVFPEQGWLIHDKPWVEHIPEHSLRLKCSEKEK
jgi:hypothetical protein